MYGIAQKKWYKKWSLQAAATVKIPLLLIHISCCKEKKGKILLQCYSDLIAI
jgi:hypothetical protein